MERKPIAIEDLNLQIYRFFEIDWLLLTSGDFSAAKYNAMTISWGSIGVMWNKPFVQVVVRPQRYTFEFIERYDTFSVCAFPRQYHQALSLLGTKSGRDGNKIQQAGFTPLASTCIAAPSFEQASLVIECRKVYWQDYDPQNFLDPAIAKNYPARDYHRAYFGEILAVLGSDEYCRSANG